MAETGVTSHWLSRRTKGGMYLDAGCHWITVSASSFPSVADSDSSRARDQALPKFGAAETKVRGSF